MARSSKIIIAKNIKLDKEYKEVLNYSENDMLSLVNDNKVASADNYSFIRDERGVISVAFSYSDCLKCNYMAFQNKDYDNKWFFAFIDDIKYVNDSTTQIVFTVDAWSTWFSKLNISSSFVIREHVSDDTIGLHTIPENLETGEYICNSHYKDSTMDNYSSDLCYVMASTSMPVAGPAKDTVAGSKKYNGIYTGLTYFEYESSGAIDTILEIFANDGKTDAINGIFMAPKWLAPIGSDTYRRVTESNAPLSFNIDVSKQTTLNGYSPKNNKVKCFPYNYLLVSNNIGQNAILHYEKFSGANASFTVRGVLNPGCSINLTPTNYNGNTSSDNDAIQLGKFPICNFQNDMYTNWLTQNSINVLGMTITSDDMNIASSILGGISGTLTSLGSGNLAGAGMSVTSGLQNVASSVMQQKQHNMISPTVSGQLNSADVNVASGNNTFHFYKMSVKQEYARVIDDFFTRFGYKVNRNKVPNITGRTYWNYIQISDSDNFGSGEIPQKFMDEINMIARRGVTIWHNHQYLGDYTLNNTIVS